MCLPDVDHILKATLCLYMENHYEHPLPTPEEVLVCTPSTTTEEVRTAFKGGAIVPAVHL